MPTHKAVQADKHQDSESLAVDLRHYLKQAHDAAQDLKLQEKGFVSPGLKTIIGSLEYLRKLAG